MNWFLVIARPSQTQYHLLLREPRSIKTKTMKTHLQAFTSYFESERFFTPSRGVRILAVCFDKGVPMGIDKRIEEFANLFHLNTGGGDYEFLPTLLMWSFRDRCLIHILMTALDHAAIDFFGGSTDEFKTLHVVVASIRHHFGDIVIFVLLHIARRRYGQRRGTHAQDHTMSHGFSSSLPFHNELRMCACAPYDYSWTVTWFMGHSIIQRP